MLCVFCNSLEYSVHDYFRYVAVKSRYDYDREARARRKRYNGECDAKGMGAEGRAAMPG